MDKLWAPWRVRYFRKKRAKGCIFCRIYKEKKDKKNFILARKKYSFSVLNIFPYNNGHILIVPQRHIAELDSLRKEEKLELFDLLGETKKLVAKKFKPDGFNLGINFGQCAGAGLEDHLHIHLVPRWIGDANFMPVLADAKIIGESLKSAYQRLKGT